MNSPLLNLEVFARYIGVSKAAVYRYLKQKKLPAIKMGRFWKFKKERIDAWLDRQERA